MEILDKQLSDALILVAVLASLIGPVLFNKLFQKMEKDEHKYVISVIGSNQMTLPVVRELDPDLYETHLYHTKNEKMDEQIAESCFDIKEVENYDVKHLEALNVFDADLLVVATGDEETNAEIAIYAKEQGVDRVIARAESPERDQYLRSQNVDVFSVLLSNKTLLKAMIVAPSLVHVLTEQENQLYQINMNNSTFDGIMLRNFPFTGDVIIVRVFRGKDSIVPHGDTELKMGDRLIVTGSREYVEELRNVLEFCDWC